MTVVKKLDKVALEWVKFLEPYDFNYMATFTFRNNHGKFFIGPNKAFKIQRNYFNALPQKIERFFTVAEPHQWRENVHLHTLFKSSIDKEILWRFWWSTEKSHARILDVNDKARSYCAKYLNKYSDVSNDWKLERKNESKEGKLF